MNIGLVTVILFGGLLVSLLLGTPMSFALGGLAVIFTALLWGPQALSQVAQQMFGGMNVFVLAAIPLFIFMAAMLTRSGVTEALYDAAYHILGTLRGGLAMATIAVATVFAALCGSSAASTATIGLTTLPSLLKRKYATDIALGSIMAGGALGILIPPSVTMVLLGFIGEVSVGRLFIGGILPGLLLSTLFMIYIGVRCWISPGLGPPIPLEERTTLRQKVTSLRSVILPILLIVVVLGAILAGVATPTEAAALGATGSIFCAFVNRRLTWASLKETCYETARLSSMVMWIVFAAMAFTTLYHAMGASELITNLLAAVPGGRWGAVIAMQIILFILGMFMDPAGIIMVTAPIFLPVIRQMGFSDVWFGVLFILNMEMAFLTPPFGANIFMMRAIAPQWITTGKIINSVWYFVVLQAVGLVICMIFPQIILWMPGLMIK